MAGTGSLAESRRDPERVLSRDLGFETERHAVVLPDECVAGKAKGLDQDIPRGVPIEEEVRGALEPQAAAAIDSETFDPGVRPRALSPDEVLIERAAELHDEHADAGLVRDRDTGALPVHERDPLARARCIGPIAIDLIGRSQARIVRYQHR